MVFCCRRRDADSVLRLISSVFYLEAVVLKENLIELFGLALFGPFLQIDGDGFLKPLTDVGVNELHRLALRHLANDVGDGSSLHTVVQ